MEEIFKEYEEVKEGSMKEEAASAEEAAVKKEARKGSPKQRDGFASCSRGEEGPAGRRDSAS